MKRQENSGQDVLRDLGLFKMPPEQEVSHAETRMENLLRTTPVALPDDWRDSGTTGSNWRPKRRALVLSILAAAVLLGVFLTIPRHLDADAIVADGSFFRVVGDTVQVVHPGERIEAGEILRTNDANGFITIADSSRVEMRAHSEFSLERADDGVRIVLSRGGVIINAAKQFAGHLYVQTKDVTVSVVGTVFLVNAEEEGSRVAVIEGEVRVQQGKATKNLLPGDQLSSNPQMPPLQVKEELSWSRHADAHVALLQQSSASSITPKPPKFEVATIKPSDGEIDGIRCKGIDGVWSTSTINNAVTAAIPQGRCVGSTGLTSMIANVYGVPSDRVIGVEPGVYQVEAKAETQATATKEQLRQMLQNLIIDRFKLKTRVETREGQGYFLSVAKDGVKFKETSSDEGDLRPAGCVECLLRLLHGNFSLKTFANKLRPYTGDWPVVDKTGLPGIYELRLTLNPMPSAGGGGPRAGTGGSRKEYDPSLAKALEEQLGLRLESGRQVPIEYLVIDHIEKPLEN